MDELWISGLIEKGGITKLIMSVKGLLILQAGNYVYQEIMALFSSI